MRIGIAWRWTTSISIRRSNWQRCQSMAKHRRYGGSKKGPAQKKPPLTHFLCVPLVNQASRPLLEASISEFRTAVSVSDENDGKDSEYPSTTGQKTNLAVIHPKAIRPVGSLHLTLGVMSLDEQRLSEAVEYLKGNDVRQLLSTSLGGASELNDSEVSMPVTEASSSLERPITPSAIRRKAGPLEVQLKGIASMHPAHKTSILYIAPDDETGRLQPFCVALQKLFKEDGFLIEDNRELKLHATIVNTIYTKDRKRTARRDPKNQNPNHTIAASSATDQTETSAVSEQAAEGNDSRSQGHGPNANAPLKIDATAVLEAYRDFMWAENVVLDRVAICEMGAKKTFDEEGKEVGAEYTEVASIPLLA